MSRLFEIAISAIVLFITVGLNKPFNFSQLWRIALLVLALDLLTQAAFPEITILRCVESSAWDLIVLFAWLTLSDIAHHSKLSFALGFRHWLGVLHGTVRYWVDCSLRLPRWHH